MDPAVKAHLARKSIEPAEIAHIAANVKLGRASVLELARATHVPYGAALIQRPGGAMVAADLQPGLRAAGERAAQAALTDGRCVLDLSALHVLGFLPERDRFELLLGLPDLIVPLAASRDAIRSRDMLRSLTMGTFTTVLQVDGTLARIALAPTQRARLRDQAEQLEEATSVLQADHEVLRNDLRDATIATARRHGVPVWCDDVALRQQIRAQGVQTFGILDFLTLISGQNTTCSSAIDLPSILRRLANEYVLDLPLTADDLISLAEADDWLGGPAHAALARPAPWQGPEHTWKTTWLTVATQARRHSAHAHLEITKAALAGSVGVVSEALRTQRYQQVVVIALLGCHLAEEMPEPGFLDALLELAVSVNAPQTQYVRLALEGELSRLKVAEAPLAAARLIADTRFA